MHPSVLAWPGPIHYSARGLTFGHHLANNVITREAKIAHGVEHLVLHELVGITQAALIHDAVLTQHDGIVGAAALGQIIFSQELDVTHEAIGAGPADFPNESGGADVDRSGLLILGYRGVVVFDIKGNSVPVKGLQPGEFVRMTNLDGFQNSNKLFR